MAKNWRIEVKTKILRKTLCARSNRIKNWPKKVNCEKKTDKPKIKKNWQKTGEKNNEETIAKKQPANHKNKKNGKKQATENQPIKKTGKSEIKIKKIAKNWRAKLANTPGP